MKSRLELICFLSLALLIAACNKGTDDAEYWGKASAMKNGAVWSASTRCLNNKPYNQGIDIDFDVFDSAKRLKESLFVYKLPDQEGSFTLNLTSVRDVDSLHGAVFHSFEDDGTAGDSYVLIEGILENRVKITQKKGSEYWGEFQAAFVKNTLFGTQDPATPDTVVFSDGRFHVKLKH